MTVGSGTIAVRAPRVNDKRVDEQGERQKFSSRILPAYARRSPKVGEVIPILYLRGLSTGDFRPALEGLLGEDAAGLSASTVSRLCKEWETHHDRFRQRLLSFSRYAYLFMDGIHVQVRLGEDDRVCLLIVIGVREDGVKELLAVEDGYRESTEKWAGVFRDLKRRGLNEPKLVVGDGALGAWAALRDVFPGAGEQRCWFHASGNVIDALPKRLQPRAKGLLSEIIEAPTRKDATRALEVFREEYGAKYPKALAKLDRDWEAADGVLRLPRRALAPSADHESDRVELRDRPPAHPRHEGRRLEGRRARDGLQAARERARALATLQRTPARRRRAQRREVQGRHQGHRRRHRYAGREGRRLNILHCPSTTFDNCSNGHRWNP